MFSKSLPLSVRVNSFVYGKWYKLLFFFFFAVVCFSYKCMILKIVFFSSISSSCIDLVSFLVSFLSFSDFLIQLMFTYISTIFIVFLTPAGCQQGDFTFVPVTVANSSWNIVGLSMEWPDIFFFLCECFVLAWQCCYPWEENGINRGVGVPYWT